MKSTKTRVENIESMLKHRRPEINMSRYTPDELKELAELNRSQRYNGTQYGDFELSGEQLARYQEIIKAAESRRTK